jgi:glucokinase
MGDKYHLSDQMKLAGVEIGGTKLQIVLGDETGAISERVTQMIDATHGAVAIKDLIEAGLKKFGKVDGVGVGFGGPVNRQTGVIWTSYQVEGWKGLNIPEWLGKVASAPVVVDNDGNTAALAEAIAGAGKEDRIVFYVTLGSGVGGGLVIDGDIYHGRLPGEVEFGHILLDTSGRTVEESCSAWAVNAWIRGRVLQRKSVGLLADLAAKNKVVETKALLPAMEAGDPDALEIFEATTADIAFALSHVVHLFHPDTIIIGGGLSLMGEPLRASVEGKLRLLIMDAFQPGPSVRLSKLKADVVPVGALILAGRLLKGIN